jgi:hypothetical protein
VAVSFTDTEAKCRRIQQALADNGFQPGPVDGVLGPQTARAIINARVAHKLSHQDQAMVDTDLERVLGLLAIQDPSVQAGGKLLTDIIFNQLVKGQSPMDTVLATVKSAWKSKLNWTVAVGVIFNVLMFFGHPVPADVQANVVTAGNSIVLVIAWIIRTWFTHSITTASANKL